MEKYRSRFSKTEKNRWSGLTISLCIVVAFYMLLANLGNLKGFFNSFFTITSTVIIGAVIAYTVNPLAVLMNKRIEKLFKKHKNYSWIISASVSLILVLCLIVGLLALISPMLIDNITNFARGLSGYMNSLKELVTASELNDDLKNSITGFIDDQSDLTRLVSKFVLGNDITAAGVLSFSAGTVSAAFNFLIGIILAFYFLIGKKKLLDLLTEFFNLVVPTKHYENFSNVMNRLNSIFSRFIVCELIDALIVGVINAVFMFAMKMPYAVFCSVIVALCNLAPTFGPFVGAFIGAVILLLAEPQFVIPFLIFTLALQLIDGYVIKPRLFGSALKVPAFLVLVFIVVGGKIWGVPGVLLAIPLAAILSYIYRQIFVPWLSARKKAKDEAAAAKAAEDKSQKNNKAG
ncbi:MAG: AI-2E family transporter [Clostridiales bacterium]|nr:AI-2E family transporter [Clostridiales bacterium]